MRELLLWGATGQARVLYELIYGSDMKLVVLVDSRPVDPPIPMVPLVHGEAGFMNWLKERGGTENLFGSVAVGGARGRDRLMLMNYLVNNGLAIETLIHRTAFVAHGATYGEGCQVLAQSAVCANARLGRGVIVNTAASVDHDCEIGDGVHLAPGGRLAGQVKVGECAFIGTGAIVMPGIEIGADAVVGAGAVVTKDVAPATTVIGNPARVVSVNRK